MIWKKDLSSIQAAGMAAAASVLAAPAAAGPREDKFLADIRGEDADARFLAWRGAGEMDAQVIPALGKLLMSDKPGVVKAATEALSTLVHSVGKQAQSARRTQVVQQLNALLGGSQPVKVQTVVLRLLSLVGGDETVAAAARLLIHPELAEEAAFCIERIPGKASTAALAGAYKDVKDGFKPRILAALGHRRAEEGVSICAAAMRSPNRDIAMAAMKAFGRIGKKPSGQLRFPDYDPLSDWEKTEYMDSLLRYADGQVEQGNHTEAIRIYKQAMERTEEHFQCAGIVGLSKVGTSEAAALIFPKLKSSGNTVRLTAKKAWERMAGG